MEKATSPAQKPKRVIKTQKVAAPVKAKPVKAAKAAAAPKVNVHVAAGVNVAAYAGPSSMINANRKVKIMLRDNRDTASMTDRMQKSLYSWRAAYSGKHFEAKGLDNGILRDLASAGLVSLSGGQKETIDGKPYLIDGERPVMVLVTKAGQEYGKTA